MTLMHDQQQNQYEASAMTPEEQMYVLGIKLGAEIAPLYFEHGYVYGHYAETLRAGREVPGASELLASVCEDEYFIEDSFLIRGISDRIADMRRESEAIEIKQNYINTLAGGYDV